MIAPDEPGRSPRATALLALKALWVLLVLSAGVWYLTQNWVAVSGYVSDLGSVALLGSFMALTAARVTLAAISRACLKMNALAVPLGRSLAMNSASQLGKYLPGGVWHLVGRAGLYRSAGLTTKRASGVLVLENAILVASGLSVSILPAVALVWDPAGGTDLDPAGSIALMAGSWLLIVVGLVLVRRTLRSRYTWAAAMPSLKLAGLNIAFWSLLGVAFWLLLPPHERLWALLPMATGIFAAAWVLGYLAPFAPAGVGVREGLIVAMLGPLVGVPMAVGAAAASRLLWTVNELLLASGAVAFLSSSSPDERTRRKGAPRGDQAEGDRSDRSPELE